MVLNKFHSRNTDYAAYLQMSANSHTQHTLLAGLHVSGIGMGTSADSAYACARTFRRRFQIKRIIANETYVVEDVIWCDSDSAKVAGSGQKGPQYNQRCHQTTHWKRSSNKAVSFSHLCFLSHLPNSVLFFFLQHASILGPRASYQ